MPQQTPFSRRTWNLVKNPNRTFGAKLVTLKNLLVLFLKKVKRLRVTVKPTRTWRHFGWGMASHAALPWDRDDSTDQTGLEFAEANQRLLNKIEQNQFIVSQWKMIGETYSIEPSKTLDLLSWRHYLVFWTAKYSARFTKSSKLAMVEAGVCDGMTINFAISALETELGKNSNFEVFLYDSWSAIKEEHLTTKEMFAAGDYAYLSMEQTKINLEEFQERCRFVKGYIPDVFKENAGPNEISWLHIDLNSSMPTLKTLEHFVPRLLPGGLVLFDDYGWRHCEETKEVADKFCSKFEGLMMPFPTGQAIFFKH